MIDRHHYQFGLLKQVVRHYESGGKSTKMSVWKYSSFISLLFFLSYTIAYSSHWKLWLNICSIICRKLTETLCQVSCKLSFPRCNVCVVKMLHSDGLVCCVCVFCVCLMCIYIKVVFTDLGNFCWIIIQVSVYRTRACYMWNLRVCKAFNPTLMIDIISGYQDLHVMMIRDGVLFDVNQLFYHIEALWQYIMKNEYLMDLPTWHWE